MRFVIANGNEGMKGHGIILQVPGCLSIGSFPFGHRFFLQYS
jgi:hypothetical protein